MGSKSGPGGNAFHGIEQRQIDEIVEKVAAVGQTASDQIEIGKQKVGSALEAANERGKTAGRMLLKSAETLRPHSTSRSMSSRRPL